MKTTRPFLALVAAFAVSYFGTQALSAIARSATAEPWTWSGTFSNKAVELLILGDIQIHSRRADPTTAFNRMRDTLKKADLVYANLEGLLVKSVGTKIDIPDKPEWTHPGPDGVKGLKAANVAIVGVAPAPAPVPYLGNARAYWRDRHGTGAPWAEDSPLTRQN